MKARTTARVALKLNNPTRYDRVATALTHEGHTLVPWSSTPAPQVKIVAHGDSQLKLMAGKRRVFVDFNISSEALAFWINELGYSGARRAGARVPIELPVELAIDKAVVHTVSVDISSGGLFVATAAPPAIGSAVAVVLHLDDGAPPLRSLGKVVHIVHEHGEGLRDESGTSRCAHPGAAIDLIGIAESARQRLAARVIRQLESLHRSVS